MAVLCMLWSEFSVQCHLYIFFAELPTKLLVQQSEHGGGGQQIEGGDLAGPLHPAQPQHPLQALNTLPLNLACTSRGAFLG